MAITKDGKLIVANIHELFALTELAKLPNGTYDLERAPNCIVSVYYVCNGCIKKEG